MALLGRANSFRKSNFGMDIGRTNLSGLCISDFVFIADSEVMSINIVKRPRLEQ